MQHERLHVKQPEGGHQHSCDDKRQENSRTSVTKSGEDGTAKSRKVGQRSEGGRRNPTDTGIDATKHSRATPGATNKIVTGQVRYREIGSISQSNERNYRDDGIKNNPRARPAELRRFLS